MKIQQFVESIYVSHLVTLFKSALLFSVNSIFYKNVVPKFPIFATPYQLRLGSLKHSLHSIPILPQTRVTLILKSGLRPPMRDNLRDRQDRRRRRRSSWHSTYEEKSPKNQNPISQKPADQTPTPQVCMRCSQSVALLSICIIKHSKFCARGPTHLLTYRFSFKC